MRRLALLALAGCGELVLGVPGAPAGGGGAPPSAGRPALTMVLAGAVPRRDDVRAALTRAAGPGFDVRFAELPSAPPNLPSGSQAVADLAAARAAYVGAEFAACLAAVGRPDRAAGLLGDGKRLLAERLLFWRLACEVGGGKKVDARRDAAAFRVLELEVPPDVEATAPEVEQLIADEGRTVAFGPRLPLAVRVTFGNPALEPVRPASRDLGGVTPAAARAVIAIDGRPAACAAPCTLDLHPGDHMIRVDADGFVPESRLVRVDPPASEATFQLAPAGPDLAAEQWTSRYAGSPAIDSPSSVALLAVATRAGRLALVAAEKAPAGTRLTGVLAVDGAVAARGERSAARDSELPDAASALARDLLVRGQLIEAEAPLYKKPLFWVGVGVAAVAAATVTALLLYHPTSQVKVTLEVAR